MEYFYDYLLLKWEFKLQKKNPNTKKTMFAEAKYE